MPSGSSGLSGSSFCFTAYGDSSWPRRAPGSSGGGWPYGFGFLGGLFGGAISASGPPVIVYVTLQPWSKDVLKATLQGFFLFSGIVVIFFQAREGLMTEPVLRLFLYSIIPILTGTWLGHVLYGRLGERSYRSVVFAMLGLLGIFTLVRSL